MTRYIYEFQKRKLYDYLGEDLVEIFKSNNVIIAGGCINSIFNNKEINDIDTYFRCDDDIINVIYEIYESYWVLSNTKKAILFKNDKERLIQLIHFRRFDNAEEIFNTFDFTVCMGAFDFKTEEFILHDNFLLDNTQRVLHFNSDTVYPIMSLLRVDKYKNKGYKISKSEFIRIILDCMDLNIKTIDELKEQMGGMYGLNFSKIFEDVDITNNKINLKEIISKLSDLYLDENYFNGIDNTEIINFDGVEELIECALHIPIKYIMVNNKKYKITFIGKLEDGLKEKDNIKYMEVSANEYFKDKKFYKVVNRINNELCSCYDNKFKYELNREAIPTYGNKQIYCNYKDCINKNTYYDSNNNNKVILEMEINYNDLVEADDNVITFRKVKPIRIVDKEEYIKWIE